MMMVPKLCLTLICFTLGVFLVSGAPRLTERRSPRSIDKSAALHARLRLLHKQIHDLVAEQERRQASGRGGEEEETENDVSDQLRDVNRLRGGTEPQLTSERQKQELADTLDQLLRESLPERSGTERTNTAGEYLSDKFNKHREEDDDDDDDEHAISRELQSEAKMDRRKKEEYKEAEEEEEEEEEAEEEGEEGEKEGLQTIYKMLVRLYNQQQHQNGRGGEEEEEPAKRKTASRLPPRRLADEGASSHFASRPDFQADEGTFGDFVDTEAERRPSVSAQYKEELRNSVLSAIESRLLEDLQDARDVGISVDDIIQDVQGKARKKEHLSHIESELDRLSGRD